MSKNPPKLQAYQEPTRAASVKSAPQEVAPAIPPRMNPGSSRNAPKPTDASIYLTPVANNPDYAPANPRRPSADDYEVPIRAPVYAESAPQPPPRLSVGSVANAGDNTYLMPARASPYVSPKDQYQAPTKNTSAAQQMGNPNSGYGFGPGTSPAVYATPIQQNDAKSPGGGEYEYASLVAQLPRRQSQPEPSKQPPPTTKQPPAAPSAPQALYKGKDLCPICGIKPTKAKIQSLDRVWHEECFKCTTCQISLISAVVYESDQRPYCEKHFKELFCDHCAYCKKPIVDQAISALGQKWHVDHFFCMRCGCKFDQTGFHEKDGQAYCSKDYLSLFSQKCFRCNEVITKQIVTSLNKHWHQECFKCTDCSATFPNGEFFEIDGLPYCPAHYSSRNGLICAGCAKEIAGRCINVGGKRYHPEHLVCYHCKKQLTPAGYKQHENQPYCLDCAPKNRK